MLAVNVTALADVSRAFINQLRANVDGYLLNITSVAAYLSIPNHRPHRHVTVSFPCRDFIPDEGLLIAMRIRRSSAVLLAVGVVLVIAALVERLVLVPVLTKLPASTDITLSYAGTASALNSEAIAKGDVANALATNVPTALARHIYVVHAGGDSATVADDIKLSIGALASNNNHTYLLDRSTLTAVSSASVSITHAPAGCLTTAFPIAPEPNNSYRLYDSATGQCSQINFRGRTTDHGRSCYQYATTSVGTLTDPNLLTTLPKTLPRALIQQIVQLLPSNRISQLAPGLLSLPATVPLIYQSRTALTADVDATTGLAVNEQISQQVMAGISIADKPVYLLPALSVAVAFTPSTVTTMAHKAASTARLLAVLRWVAPATLLVLGLALVTIGALRRRPVSPGRRSDPPNDTLTQP